MKEKFLVLPFLKSVRPCISILHLNLHSYLWNYRSLGIYSLLYPLFTVHSCIMDVLSLYYPPNVYLCFILNASLDPFPWPFVHPFFMPVKLWTIPSLTGRTCWFCKWVCCSSMFFLWARLIYIATGEDVFFIGK